MEIEFNGYDSIDINVKEGEKCFITCNTTEYNSNNCCGVSIGDIEAMKEYGWSDKEDIKAINSLNIGERYDSADYYSTAFVIRLA